MRTDLPKTIYLKDYKPFPFSIEKIDANFDLQSEFSIITVKSVYKRLEKGADLFLFGEDLDLQSLKIDGKEHTDFEKNDSSLTVKNTPDEFELEIITKIYPDKNTRLEGLYMSGGNYCTQCEAEGFRRITYFPDRPDVMTIYTVRIEADKKFPVLLSNGNRIDGGESGADRHFTIWEDPHPKPCYLFALVAGDLTHIHDTFTTKSGNEVDLYIYVRPGDEGQCAHAMDSLKRSMKWDEEVYGLEYDLDLFNIVAVSDFNMGAMENKSLNIFNTALVLAHQDTATDQDFMRVESVIAHEYFHNWSGNRVTCRDWFQLSLKEGLTVFRDQEFSADTHSRDVQRIDDVNHLRRFQFSEDASPLSHPIRPDNYIEINNFYTATVYEKGAEVIRMMRTLLGTENYRKGTDLYFARHDGQAVTCDDFVQAMEDATGYDMSQFRLWYSQAGTPELTFKGEYDNASNNYKITLSQIIPDTTGQKDKKPMVIPLSIGLLDEHGKDITETQTLILNEKIQEFNIPNVASEPTPSVLRNFSAPVKLNISLDDTALKHLMLHDRDGFNRWEAGQRYYHLIIKNMVENNADIPESFLNAYGELINSALDENHDKALLSRMMSLPDIPTLIQHYNPADPSVLFKTREKILAAIKRTHKATLEKIYKLNESDSPFAIDANAVARRSLRNTCLSLLTATHGTGCAKMASTHYNDADNMTDRVAALATLASNKNPESTAAFKDFYTRFKEYPLVIDKWFSMQSTSTLPGALTHIKALRNHADFNIKNPNRVRSLYSAFAMNNPVLFHQEDGSGYAFLKDGITELNTINPQIGARLLTPLREWRRFTPDRQEKMQAALSEILEIKDIAPDIFEIASKSLKG